MTLDAFTPCTIIKIIRPNIFLSHYWVLRIGMHDYSAVTRMLNDSKKRLGSIVVFQNLNLHLLPRSSFIVKFLLVPFPTLPSITRRKLLSTMRDQTRECYQPRS